MTDQVGWTPLEVFEGERRHLLGLAYRLLGSVADAEDVVQDAWLRWQAADTGRVERPGAWLTTATTRLALDRLRSCRRRRERYVGPWLPEPIQVERGPEELAELSESLTIGFLTLLDNLQPLERAVYLLVEVFDRSYAEVAEIVEKSEGACRQIVSRARRKLRHDRELPVRKDEHRRAEAERLVHELLGAIATGDVEGALSRVAPDVVLVSDGGPHRRAARRPVVGAERVVRFLANVSRRQPYHRARFTTAQLNGCPGLLMWLDGRIDMALVFEVGPGGIRRVWVVLAPEKLRALAGPVPMT